MTPKSFGYVTIASGGTPVQCTVNEADPTKHVPAQAVLIQAHPDNTGVIYVGLGNMDTSTGVGVLAFVAAPADPTNGPFPSVTVAVPNIPAGLGVESLYIDGTTGDKAVVSNTAG